MLVIHPKDRTTGMLAALYEGVAQARVIDGCLSNAAICRALRHTPRTERIMLLGHGCATGLLYRDDDTRPFFNRVLVGHPQAYELRRHGSNIVAVFCNADQYARANGLHGLFTGMIISEMAEAEEYGIATTQEELDRENVKFAERMRSLLDEGVLLSDIPKRMLALNDTHSPLTDFNYANIFYL